MRPSSVRVGIHQAQPGSGITAEECARYRREKIDILVLPEYFWVRPEDADHRQSAAHFDEDLATLAALSRDESWLWVGGTMVEPAVSRPAREEPVASRPAREESTADVDPAGLEPAREEPAADVYHNTCPVFHHGQELARYRKIHLMPGEARHGLTPGERFVVVETRGLRLAPVICADVLYPDTFARVSDLHPDLILAPMSSPYRPSDSAEDKDARDREIFLTGSAAAGAPIVKAGGVGTLFRRPLQGRSLVATPDEILFRTPFDSEHERHAWVVEVPLKGETPS